MPNSLVLITVDCLRADHVGFLGYQRPTTPFLDTLSSESFAFSNAIVGGAPTYYSFPAILASRSPLAFGRDLIGLAPGELNLASVLRQQGYATAAFLAANPYLSSRFGYDEGFGRFEDFLEPSPDLDESAGAEPSRLNQRLSQACSKFGITRRLYEELYFQYCQRVATPAPKSLSDLRRFPTADVLVDQALAWLSSLGDQPFFLWLHLMDPHSPYYPNEQGLALMGDRATPSHARYLNSCWTRESIGERRLRSYRDEIIRLYDAGIRWADAQIERLVGALRKSERWDDCTLAVTADHGEEFLDHGGRHHAPSVREELIRVPLLLRVPGVRHGQTISAPFSHLHLAPTLLESLGLPIPADFQGGSYWPYLTSGQEWDDAAIVECISGCTN